MTEVVLRTFVCKYCGHEVVVNPKLPPDATPTVCTPCFDNIVIPKTERLIGQTFAFLNNICGGKP